jgi:hypothetical protein
MSADRAGDYRTYPGNRNTEHTARQRAGKLIKAERRIREARALLAEVLDDFTANGYRLSLAEREEWSAAASASDDLRRASAELHDLNLRAALEAAIRDEQAAG